ncbi:MAG: hypothetical protein SFY32_02885 [Bacteroidota bacterium]|nr:hypothetical protein [Bacteroidota bacterium]
MKNIFSLIILIIALNIGFAQEKEQVPNELPKIKKNTVFVELLGNGYLYSLNYDRVINYKSKFKQTFRIGLAYLPFSPLSEIHLPFEYNFLFGKKDGHFEMGIGLTPALWTYQYISENDTRFGFYNYLRIGYRYQKPNGGFFFRAGFMTIYHFLGYYFTSNSFVFFAPIDSRPIYRTSPTIGISFGYTF